MAERLGQARTECENWLRGYDEQQTQSRSIINSGNMKLVQVDQLKRTGVTLSDILYDDRRKSRPVARHFPKVVHL